MRVFAGQDPASLWVGWVTPDYHYYSKKFNLSKVRTVTVTLGDERGRVHERSVHHLHDGGTMPNWRAYGAAWFDVNLGSKCI